MSETIEYYRVTFDKSCPGWTDNRETNLFYLLATQHYFNNKLRSDGRIYLCEIFEHLGIPVTDASWLCGWLHLSDGVRDDYIDFGIFEHIRNKDTNDPNIALEFNVDGVIRYTTI